MNSTMKKTIWFLIAMAIFAVFCFLPAPAPMTPAGMKVIGIFFASLIMWITLSIDWPSLVTLLLLGFLPDFGFTKVFQGALGNSTVAFLLFTFILVYPLSKTNFVRRCTVFFITNRIARKGPWAFVSFLFAAVTFMGLFISPSVLFVAFMPFLENIYEVLGVKKGSKTANMMMMGSAFAISLSSGMTAIGHVWPTLVIGSLKSTLGIEVNQFQYMAFGIPAGIIILVLMILMFRFLYRPSDLKEIRTDDVLSLKGTIPKADRKEKLILITMAAVILLWIVPSFIKTALPDVYATVNGWTTAMPPLLGCIILFLVNIDNEPVLNFKEVMSKGVLWAAIIMTGAATMLGSAITSDATGISAWLSAVLSPLTASMAPVVLLIFFVLWTIVETNFSSNIVTTTVVSAVALAVLPTLPAGSISIPAVVCLIGFGAAICNMTPAGQSTINTVAIGSGWTTAKDMFVWGGVFAVIALIVMCAAGYPLGSIFMG